MLLYAPMHIVCHALLRTIDGKFLLQQRDRKAGIAKPGVVSFFGGSLEGAESPEKTVQRELFEELELQTDAADMRLLYTTTHLTDDEQVTTWYIYLVCGVDPVPLRLHEGAAMCVLSFEEIQDHPLIPEGVKVGLREHEESVRIGFAA